MKRTRKRSLGVGVGLRPEHYELFLDGKPSTVSWVEAHTEFYLDDSSQQAQILEEIRANVPIALHGVSMSLGSADPLSEGYLKKLRRLIDRIRPELISDHLSWSGVAGINTHELLPLPFTERVIRTLVEKIEQAQDFLGRRILVENVSSYCVFEFSEMTEWQFISEVVQRSDCLLLLDVNNVYVSSVNNGFDPCDFINGIPAARVQQIHLAGHRKIRGRIIDTHNNYVAPPVWDLYRAALARCGSVSTMIEWDSDFPSWRAIETDLKKVARELEASEVARA